VRAVGSFHPTIGDILSDIGLVYEQMSEFRLALRFYQVVDPHRLSLGSVCRQLEDDPLECIVVHCFLRELKFIIRRYLSCLKGFSLCLLCDGENSRHMGLSICMRACVRVNCCIENTETNG